MLGHTEWIKDNSNPKFQTLIECEYHFEKKQVPTAFLPRAPAAARAQNRLLSVAGRRGAVEWQRGRLLTRE